MEPEDRARPHGSYTSLAQYLPARAAHEPARIAYIFLQTDGAEQRISYERLYGDALRYARALQQANVEPGDLVLLAFEHGYEVTAAFWGAIHLGAVPMLLPYVASEPTAEVYQRPLRSTAEFSEARAVLTLPPHVAALTQWVAGTRCSVVGEPSPGAAGPTPAPTTRAGEDLAYLVLTTGSTGASKGAMLSHRSSLLRIGLLPAEFGLRPGETIVQWWPFYQSGGLSHFVILPILLGGTGVNIPPAQWAQQPHVLMRALHRYGGVYNAMPNTGLSHCVRAIRDRDLEGIDLRGWRALPVAGEMVQLDTLQSFAERFAPHGFAARALRPYYTSTESSAVSVAEARDSLQVDWISADDLEERQLAVPRAPRAAGARPVVSCGRLAPGVEVTIRDDAGRPLPERGVGEIAVRSPMMFSGYYRRPDLTARVLRDGWLWTGDVGYLAEGQLYLCDRKKDIIITGGRNISAVDVEAAAERALGVTAGAVAAFGLPDAAAGTELAVLVAEVGGGLPAAEHAALARRIRQEVFRGQGVALADVRFVGDGWIVRTPKLSRSASRRKYVECGFAPPAGQARARLPAPRSSGGVPPIGSRAELEQLVTEVFCGVLGIASAGPDESFHEAGGDSLLFVDLLVSLESRLGRDVPVETLAEHPTIAGMVDALEPEGATRPPSPAPEGAGVKPGTARRQRGRAAEGAIAARWRHARKSVWRSVIYTGPHALGWTAPYATGAAMLEALCRRTPMMRRLFRPRVAVLRKGLVALGRTSGDGEVLRQHLRAHLWWRWRVAALARCPRAEFERWVTVKGAETLHRALRDGRGVVVSTSHFGPRSCSMLVLRHMGVDDLLVVGAGVKPGRALALPELAHLKDRHHLLVADEERRRLAQLFTGRALLLRGGIVLMAGDAYQGTLPFSLRFCGRPRRFGAGHAKLAVNTGAAIIPMFLAVTPGGGISVEFLDPLEGEGRTSGERTASLVRRYAALLEARWTSDPGNIHLYQMTRFLRSPVADDGA